MGFLSFIFPSKPKNGAMIVDPKLGEIVWDTENNEWTGEINGLKFSIAYEKNQLEPTSEIIEYTHKIVLDPQLLKKCLEKEIEAFIDSVPEMKNIPEQMEEVNSLYVESTHIGENPKGYWTFVCLGPEMPERVWRMELLGTESNGLGFDS